MPLFLKECQQKGGKHYIGIFPSFSPSIFFSSMSMHQTWFPISAKHVPETSPT